MVKFRKWETGRNSHYRMRTNSEEFIQEVLLYEPSLYSLEKCSDCFKECNQFDRCLGYFVSNSKLLAFKPDFVFSDKKSKPQGNY